MGGGWGTAFHTDVYHQGPSTSIGVNVEVTKKVSAGRAIGVNIQSKGLTTEEAINIQTAPIDASDATAPPQPSGEWATGIRFEANCVGKRAIWVEGTWEAGLDLGKSSLVMGSDTKLFLEESRQVCMVYNSTMKRIEFRNGDAVIGFLALDQEEHQL
jgi:hypothetical protein